jgi:hypothetical protein
MAVLHIHQALATGVVVNAFSRAALACTVCYSDTGKQVRAGIFGPDFGFNLLVTVIPFLILLAITTIIYFSVPGGASEAPASRSEMR